VLVRWEHGLNVHQAVERAALLRIEAVGIATGVESSGALVRRQLAQGAEAAADCGLLILWQRGPVARGRADLIALLRREVLHIFVALDESVALLLRHGIELGEAIAHALLRGLRQIVEAGLVLKRLLLLGGVESAVLVHPLGQMFAARGVGAVVRSFASLNRSKLLLLGLDLPRLRLVLRARLRFGLARFRLACLRLMLSATTLRIGGWVRLLALRSGRRRGAPASAACGSEPAPSRPRKPAAQSKAEAELGWQGAWR